MDFYWFSVDEFETYIYIFYFNGLKNYPQLSQNFKNEEDTLQGNYFLVPVFDPSSARRVNQF